MFFHAFRGIIPIRIALSKTVVGILLQQDGWMSQECIEEQRAGQCGAVGRDPLQVTAAQLCHCWRAVVVGTSKHGEGTQTRQFPPGLGGVVSNFIPVPGKFFHGSSLISSLLLPTGQKRRLLWRATPWWSHGLRSGGV